MKRLSQRQWLGAIDRALDRAGREADAKYGLKKKGKPSAKPKTKTAAKPVRKARAAAE
jgi:hypothetical protein